MNTLHHSRLRQACHVLFGPDVDVNLAFLSYIQPSGIKSAYRRMARETHPDMAVAAGEGAAAGRFIETREAYETLLDYIKSRDTRHAPARQRPSSAWTAAAKPCQRASAYHYTSRQGARAWGAGGAAFTGRKLPARRLMIGEFLFLAGYVTWPDLSSALDWQRLQSDRLGEIAIRKGMLTEKSVGRLVFSRMFGEQIGEAAIRLKLLKRWQVNALLFHQRAARKPFGEYFVINGLMTKPELAEAIQALARHNRQHI